jgi:hypothetical protein
MVIFFILLFYTAMKKNNKTIFYIALIVAVLNSIAFLVEANWAAFIFFILATFATYSIKPDKTFALVTGIIVSNVYRATNGVHEGLSTSKSTQGLDKKSGEENNLDDLHDEVLPNERTKGNNYSSKASGSKMSGTGSKPSGSKASASNPFAVPDRTKKKSGASGSAATLDDDEDEDEENTEEGFETMLGGKGAFEGLMDRQTQLMKNLKNMQPMIAQAKSLLNALPKGLVKQALQQFKLKQI